LVPNTGIQYKAILLVKEALCFHPLQRLTVRILYGSADKFVYGARPLSHSELVCGLGDSGLKHTKCHMGNRLIRGFLYNGDAQLTSFCHLPIFTPPLDPPESHSPSATPRCYSSIPDTPPSIRGFLPKITFLRRPRSTDATPGLCFDQITG
jgi:hypothetical protein